MVLLELHHGSAVSEVNHVAPNWNESFLQRKSRIRMAYKTLCNGSGSLLIVRGTRGEIELGSFANLFRISMRPWCIR